MGRPVIGGGWQRKTILPETWPLNGQDWRLHINRRPGVHRLTVRLCALSDSLRIVAPPRCRTADILAFLQDSQALLAARATVLPPRTLFQDGAVIPFRGDRLSLRHAPHTARTSWDPTTATLWVGGQDAHFPRRVQDALKSQATALIRQACHNTQHHAARLATPRPIGRITVTDTRSRWGSCAANGDLRFSWRLICAPDWVWGYVVAHEVAHLVEMSHSADFWRITQALCPQTPQARDWLRHHATALQRIGPAKIGTA